MSRRKKRNRKNKKILDGKSGEERYKKGRTGEGICDGWNAGNGIVFGAPLKPHIDSTAIVLLALTESADPAVVQGLNWLRVACVGCSSAYSLAWSAIAFSLHEDQVINRCIANLHKALSSMGAISDVEALSLAAIAINAVQGNANPFQVVI